jgi:threonine dehydrogenase-like Zn-dependent dehydrogenase
VTATMRGVALPGNSTVEHVEVPVPEPGPGQVLLAVRASSICGSDIRAIYREHLGRGPEAYQGVIAGHEPCGEVVAVGPGCRRLAEGDRVVVYHIAGCGACDECRRGYPIGCSDPSRAAYGWQRDGGHAEYLLAEEASCIPLPGRLSFVDGALVSCGFGTAYEALLRLGVSGTDTLLVTGLGPVGLAAAMLGRALGAGPVIGTDVSPERRALAIRLGLVDHAVPADDAAAEAIRELTGGHGCEATIDCSGNAGARHLALSSTRHWGRCAFVGEGGTVSFDVSQLLIHRQISLHGSWVTSVAHMEQLLELLNRWDLHPERIVTDRYRLADADQAYRAADAGTAGKVCIVADDGSALDVQQEGTTADVDRSRAPRRRS